MAKLFCLTSIVSTAIASAHRHMSFEAISSAAEGPSDEEKYNEKCDKAVPGSEASRFGSVLGGLKECACKDKSSVIATAIGTRAWGDLTLDGNWNSFKYEKKHEMMRLGHRCMPETERLYREAKLVLEKAIDFKKTSTASWVFLGIGLDSRGLQAAAEAFTGKWGGRIHNFAFFFNMECEGREFQYEGLDKACAASKAALGGHHQSEAKSCMYAVRGLEEAKDSIDGGKFNRAVALVTETAQILQETNSADAAMPKGLELRQLMDSIVLDLLPRVAANIG